LVSDNLTGWSWIGCCAQDDSSTAQRASMTETIFIRAAYTAIDSRTGK
jgi:hypothetical protein